MSTHSKRLNDIWNVKELLRDRYKRHEYGKVILPLTVLRRLESVLAPTRAEVVAEAEQYDDPDTAHVVLEHIAKKVFYNTSKFTFANLLDDEDNIIENWLEMIRGFSPNAREMIKHFRLEGEIENMGAAGILFLVTKAFSEQDLSRATVTNVEMGYIYEELVRLTADLSNEEAGEHFTPREVIELMVNLVFSGEDELFSEHKIARIYDPTCGTGGMLTAAQDFITWKNDKARVHLYGQEIQPESFATCQADMMLEDRDSNIEFGDTLKPYTLVDGERVEGVQRANGQSASVWCVSPGQQAGTPSRSRGRPSPCSGRLPGASRSANRNRRELSIYYLDPVDGDAFPTERFSYMFANPPFLIKSPCYELPCCDAGTSPGHQLTTASGPEREWHMRESGCVRGIDVPARLTA